MDELEFTDGFFDREDPGADDLYTCDTPQPYPNTIPGTFPWGGWQ